MWVTSLKPKGEKALEWGDYEMEIMKWRRTRNVALLPLAMSSYIEMR